ncbi:MAG TPA: FAD-linked oxidase C-terminal domain-containing protein [Flavobacteriaceae bacterium]|nr:FAD-linked oxidase C-terminal domain-containing protein [Flavobacteriaceae bacterium]
MHQNNLKWLQTNLEGELLLDKLNTKIYATDASVYREIPLAVAYPKTVSDLKKLIQFCRENQTSLIPRAAGTSLAGQCVGKGIVVDISKYFTQTLDFDPIKQTITVQPGVVRDDMNRQIETTGLFLGPNTSTSNRAMIGGMVGNNSSGTTSIKYGVTRDKVLELHALLSDGSEVVFKEVSKEEFKEKLKLQSLEGKIYRMIFDRLSSEILQNEIRQEFPKPEIHRRNTGYAVDCLLDSEIFSDSNKRFNMCQLLTGSEGTLAFTTKIKLKLDRLPPQKTAMIAAHFQSIKSCLLAVPRVMKQGLFTCEMMDKVILDRTNESLKYQKNKFFIQGDPIAILMLQICDESENGLQRQIENLLEVLKNETQSYANSILYGGEIEMALELRKAGLGLLGNIVGDEKTVACIEDTAVALPDLPKYISEFSEIMKTYRQKAVYYAHAGAGELHLRPILNLKKKDDVRLFQQITEEVADLVKKFGGSLSGEHGDGRVRAQFVEKMVGKVNYRLFEEIKQIFDPYAIFNPGKITNAAPMDTSLRYEPGREEPEIKTLMDFSDSLGILRAAERCNGSGDCRKSASSGGTMCPSYRATRNEKDTTRARANALREFLTHSEKPNKFDHEELKEVFDLCISCKGCHNECPSGVDAAVLKAEFQYNYQKVHGSSLRTKIFAYNDQLNQYASLFPGLYNSFSTNSSFSKILKKILRVAPERSIPRISKKSFRKIIASGKINLKPENPIKTVYLFVDEFTNYLDVEIGLECIDLLVKLRYEVKIIEHSESGRAFISKGFLEQAKKCVDRNISVFEDIISDETPLVGIEPSAILGFRDEYLRLAENKTAAQKLSKNVFLIEEFLQTEIKLGNISASQFTEEKKSIKIHGHCHQKALSNIVSTFDILNLPKNFHVTVIPSGCCGMAGSFGFEKEHYEISMNIGEQTLFPAVRKSSDEILIAANGTSCRHQILDGTQRKALHPVSILNQYVV